MTDFRNYTVQTKKFYHSDFDCELLTKHLPDPPKVIIEFGSYDGGDGVFYKQTFPEANVFSIEACPERFKTITPIARQFKIDVSNYAVCDYDGTVDFYQVTDPNVLDSDGKYGSSGSINKRTDKYKKKWKHIKEQGKIEVPCIRLDTFCKQKDIDDVDFLHVDVEGAEHKVVLGFGKLRPKMLWMETHLDKEYYGEDAYDTDELTSTLLEMGYEVVLKTHIDTLYKYTGVL